ncbi:MAG: aromatic ring-hydroxylating dioxygenase subunit alpha [Betaproteobacteria bacterium]|nr:MAG: aromatic ring-hydroxylating dioxygenase subunit alpha [Betaproteobacteria bacterium]
MDERLDDRELRASLARTCAPLAEARTLPGAVYAADAIFELECRELFARHWLAIAHHEDFAAAGSFVTADVAGERILVVRDDAGNVHALYNVCRHRGARLVTEPRGRLRGAIACPYHAWTYGLDGRLQRAPGMDIADGAVAGLALASMPLATWEGFVFANLDGKAASLGTVAGGLPDLARFHLGELRRVTRLEYEIACNWKIVCENYSECYHCPGVHPQLSRLSDLSSGGFESHAGFNGGPMALRAGVDTLSMSGRSTWSRLAAERDVARLVHYYLVYPNLMLGIHPDYLLTHRVWPIGARRARVEG